MRKGFTLIEVLAVVIILGVIITVVVTSIFNLLANSKEKAYQTLISIIEQGAELYIQQDIEGVKNVVNNQGVYEVSLIELINADIIKDDLLDPRTNQFINLSKNVLVMKDTSNLLIYCFEDNECPEPYILPFECGTTFIDSRDGEEYSTIEIDDKCWMQENLRFTGNGCLSNDWNSSSPLNACATHGSGEGANQGSYNDWEETQVLYQWEAAMNEITTEGSQGLCPNGWYIPTSNEWHDLTNHLAPNPGTEIKDNIYWDGTNSSGFTALPAGYRDSSGSLISVGSSSVWWTSSQAASWAWAAYTASSFSAINQYDYLKDNGFSIRCVKTE